MRTRTALLAGLLLVAAACAKDLDTDVLQDQIRSLLAERGGPTVTSVRCPDEVKVQAGDTFECTASGGGTTWTIEVTQRDDAGTVDMKIVGATGEGA
jgi:Domain of unknown function (DUF4333)